MSRITLELTPAQAEEWIRDLGRAIVLLDVAMKKTDDPLQKHAYVVQTLRLRDMCEALDDAAREIRRPVVGSER
jgi:hypothetical protein